MHPRKILKHAFATQHAKETHTMEDTIQLLSVMAVLSALIPGSVLFLYLAPEQVPIYAKNLGFAWMIYAEVLALGCVVLEHKKKFAAPYFTIAGFSGLLIGAGFFMSGMLAIVAGFLLNRQVKQA